MAEVKGITIEFKGDTIELDKSIKSIDNGLKALKNESQALNKALKLDPTNVETLQKKLTNLKSEQTLLTEKVKQYKEALANLGQEDIGSKEWVKLNKELDEAEAKLQIVNNSIEKVAKQPLTNLAKQLQDIGGTLENVGSKVEKIGQKFMALTGAITGLAGAGIAYNAELEKQTTLFTTLTGSAEKADEILSKIKENAKSSPFDVQSLISANQYLMATGIEGDKSMDIINALGDAVSATGGGNSELLRMAQNLQQIQNVGKASAMDIRQFAMAGIDIWGIMSDYTGKTVAQLQEMDVTFEMISGALLSASDEGGKYFGAMSAQSQTLNGKISKLKSSIQELLGQLTETLMPVIKRVIDRIQEVINYLKNLSPEQQEQILKIAEIIAVIAPLLVVIGKLITFIGTTTSNIGLLIGKITPLIASGGNLTTVMTLLKNAFSVIAGPIGVLIGLLILTYQKSETFRESVNQLVNSLIGLLAPAFNLIKSVIELVINVIKLVVQGFQELIDGIWKYSNFGTTIEKIFTGIADAITWVIDKISILIGWFQKAVDWANSLFDASNQATSSRDNLIRNGVRYDTMSGGYALASGGYNSGGVTLNANFTVNSNNISSADARSWALQMMDVINEELGRDF